jgi:hypothetical protein
VKTDAFIIDIGALSQEHRNSGSEFVGREIALLECLLDRIGKIRFALLTLVKGVGIALDVGCWGGREPDMHGIEMRQGGLPGTIDRAMGLISDDHVEIAAGELLIAADHGLEQTHGDLLFLPDHSRTEPVTAVLIQDILDGFQPSVCRALFSARYIMESKQCTIGQRSLKHV